MSWQALEDGNMGLADFGRSRFESRVAYLATLRKDGSPRVHPVTPFVAEGHLLVGMAAPSQKGHDLRRDGRYAPHCSVEDDKGGGGEFIISGQAKLTDSPMMRAIATKHAPYNFEDRHILFELGIERALATIYTEDGTKHDRWEKS